MRDAEVCRIDEPDMTPEMDASIRRLLCVCFPKDAEAFSQRRAWHDCVPAYSLVAWSGVYHRPMDGVSATTPPDCTPDTAAASAPFASAPLATELSGVVGHVAIVIREIRCGGASVTVAGVQSLAVAPDFRGTGLSRRLMTEAMDEAKRRGIAFGLLFCVPGLESFYASLGWIRTDEAVTMRDKEGRPVPIPASNIAMFKPLGSTPFPTGPIDLRGRDW